MKDVGRAVGPGRVTIVHDHLPSAESSGNGLDGRRVTIVHDYLTEMGGAERVVAVLLQMFPQAELLSSAFEPSVMAPVFAARGVRTSFLGRLAAHKPRAKRLFPLFPFAFNRMRLGPSSVVISSSSGFAHHVRPPADALHVCYCYTPPRFLWQPDEYFRGRQAVGTGLWPALAALRALDRNAARHVDEYVAISRHTARRIQAVYGREPVVIHPPVAVGDFRPSVERSGRFLIVSRLVAHKRIDVGVRAATIAALPLDVIGDGPERAQLERLAGPTVRFLGRLDDDQVRRRMAACTALLVPGTEDFGLTPVEVQASGRPPIAFAAGGALETVEDGATGYLVREPTPEAFAGAMLQAARGHLPVERLVASARMFDRRTFEDRLAAFLDAALERRAATAGASRPARATGTIAVPSAGGPTRATRVRVEAGVAPRAGALGHPVPVTTPSEPPSEP